MIPGLYITPNFISTDEEKEIISWLDDQLWSDTLSRRTQHYGYLYNYRSREAIPTTPITGQLSKLSERIENEIGLSFNQCIVNEYRRDQGISKHIDSTIFGENILSISLGEDTEIIFTNGSEKKPVFIPRLSAFLLNGDARYKWRHEISNNVSYHRSDGEKVIKSSSYRRISLTFRRFDG